jgi:xylulokinase
MTELVLGIDIGTASSKAVLADPDGAVISEAERPHGLSLPRPGWAEHDAEAVWWADILVLCRELLPGRADDVRAVCVSGIGPCLLAADENGAPLRPAILYGIDTRAEGDKRDSGALHTVAACGCSCSCSASEGLQNQRRSAAGKARA